MLPHLAHLTSVTQNCTSFLNSPKPLTGRKSVSQKIIAVVGLGYVGLPLAAETVISPIGLTQQ